MKSVNCPSLLPQSDILEWISSQNESQTRIQYLPPIQSHHDMKSGKSGISQLRTRRKSNTHQTNQNRNGKISKAVTAKFKTHST